jgi:RNA polymerase sigma-70 factor (ECF subfamily)
MGGLAPIAENGSETGAVTFEALVELHRPGIFRFALASLRDRDAAETVTQDCFLRAYQARESFRGDSSVRTWLMKIAVNLIRDVARSQRFQFWRRASASAVLLDSAGNFIPDAGSSPEARASAKQQITAMWKAVDRLSPNQRRVFLLHFMEGMDPAEIVEVTGITNATVRVHLSRAVRTVREKLRKQL